MEEMNGYEWFCANCMRMVDVLSRHGRCPTVTAIVDVAHRWKRQGASRSTEVGTLTAVL